MNNQKCQVRPKIVDISSNSPMFYPFSIKINKCSGNCNNINNPYAKICVSDTVKDLNVRAFNLMSRTNDKSCSIGEYLDYSSCKCKKKLVDPLLEESTENINETKLVNITVENKNNDRCCSCVVYKVLFWIFFVISCGTIIYIVYHVYVNRL